MTMAEIETDVQGININRSRYAFAQLGIRRVRCGTSPNGILHLVCLENR